jgi:hypothetical protein
MDVGSQSLRWPGATIMEDATVAFSSNPSALKSD